MGKVNVFYAESEQGIVMGWGFWVLTFLAHASIAGIGVVIGYVLRGCM